MSHTLHPLRRARLQRSELAVPGSNPDFIEKAATSDADYVFLDLEDAVAPSEKEQARKNVVAALQDIDWRGLGKTVSVRINGLDTHYMYRDVIDVMELAGDRVDDRLFDAADRGADDRDAARHRLDRRDAERFLAWGRRERVGGAIALPQRVPGPPTGERELRRDAFRRRDLPQPRDLRGALRIGRRGFAADHQQSGGDGVVALQPGNAAHQVVDALRRCEPPDMDNHELIVA